MSKFKYQIYIAKCFSFLAFISWSNNFSTTKHKPHWLHNLIAKTPLTIDFNWRCGEKFKAVLIQVFEKLRREGKLRMRQNSHLQLILCPQNYQFSIFFINKCFISRALLQRVTVEVSPAQLCVSLLSVSMFDHPQRNNFILLVVIPSRDKRVI